MSSSSKQSGWVAPPPPKPLPSMLDKEIVLLFLICSTLVFLFVFPLTSCNVPIAGFRIHSVSVSLQNDVSGYPWRAIAEWSINFSAWHNPILSGNTDSNSINVSVRCLSTNPSGTVNVPWVGLWEKPMNATVKTFVPALFIDVTNVELPFEVNFQSRFKYSNWVGSRQRHLNETISNLRAGFLFGATNGTMLGRQPFLI